MTQDWNSDEIIAHFTLLPPEFEFLGSNDPHNQLGKALMLKFFQQECRFPESTVEIHPSSIEYVAQQLDIPATFINEYDLKGERSKDHRKDIRELMGFRSATLADQQRLRTWLLTEVIPHEFRPVHLEQLVYQRLRREYIEPPTQMQIERLVIRAKNEHERLFFAQTYGRLSPEVRTRLRQLIYPSASTNEEIEMDEDDSNPIHHYLLHDLKAGAGVPKVDNIKKVAARLALLQEINLPADLFADIPLSFLQQYQRQVAIESISHLQRRDKPQPDGNDARKAQLYTALAAFCWVRQRTITDYLADLFMRTLRDIRLRAKSRVEKRLIADYIKVGGKQQLFFRLVQAMQAHPNGIIKDVLYPIVGTERLEALVAEAQQQGTYHQSVQTRISGSYTHHYRQILPHLLGVLNFRSNNEQHKPLIEALVVVAAYLEEKDAFYPVGQEVPLDDVIQKQWQHWIYQKDRNGRRRIRRVRYELCVLQSLRDKLRCKEIWIEHADHYRNPDEDVPADFNDNRDGYYDALNLTQDGDEFIKALKQSLQDSLQRLNYLPILTLRY